MRARVRVGETSRRSSGATRSGLIENSSSAVVVAERRTLSPACSSSSLSGSMVIAVGLDRRRGGDRAGDDLALRQQALHARVDQPGAELVEVEDADAAARRGRARLRTTMRRVRLDEAAAWPTSARRAARSALAHGAARGLPASRLGLDGQPRRIVLRRGDRRLAARAPAMLRPSASGSAGAQASLKR